MTDSRSLQLKALLKTILGSNVVRYYPALAEHIGGAKAALMMSQLLYWDSREFNKLPGGWFWVSVEAMQEQTGLTKGEQQTARKKLMGLKVCKAELKGIPRRWRYKPDIESLAFLIGESISHWAGIPPNVEKETPPTKERVPIQLNKNKDTKEETNKDINKKDGAKPTPPKKKRDPLLDHPAIIAHKEIIRLHVPIIFREAVVNIVGDSPASLNKWKQTLRDWIGSGYNPKGIKNILDKFQGGKPKKKQGPEGRKKYTEGKYADMIEH